MTYRPHLLVTLALLLLAPLPACLPLPGTASDTPASPAPIAPATLSPTAAPTPAPLAATPAPVATAYPDSVRITTAVGMGLRGLAREGDAPEVAALSQPTGLGFDRHGVLYIADTGNSRIVKLLNGVIVQAAGTTPGFSGDLGSARSAKMYLPYDIKVAPSGRFVIADVGNRRIRRIDHQTYLITTIAGGGGGGAGLGNGDGGLATSANLSTPYAVAVDATDNVYFVDTGYHDLRRVGTDGKITRVAGQSIGGFSGDGQSAAKAAFRSPQGVAVGPAGEVYVADTGNHRIRRIDAAGKVSTVAGTGTAGDAGDGGLATAAELSGPYGLAVGKDGTVHVADSGNRRVRRIAPDGTIQTVAGNGTSAFSGDGGPATRAGLVGPVGLALDATGNLYVSDWSGQFDHRVRKVTLVP